MTISGCASPTFDNGRKCHSMVGEPAITRSESYTRLRQKDGALGCENFGGDTEKVFLCGFSRGLLPAISSVYDDEIPNYGVPSPLQSLRWCKEVGAGSDSQSALSRLTRLKGRPQFITHENNGVENSRRRSKRLESRRFYFRATGFETTTMLGFFAIAPSGRKCAWMKKLPTPLTNPNLKINYYD